MNVRSLQSNIPSGTCLGIKIYHYFYSASHSAAPTLPQHTRETSRAVSAASERQLQVGEQPFTFDTRSYCNESSCGIPFVLSSVWSGVHDNKSSLKLTIPALLGGIFLVVPRRVKAFKVRTFWGRLYAGMFCQLTQIIIRELPHSMIVCVVPGFRVGTLDLGLYITTNQQKQNIL